MKKILIANRGEIAVRIIRTCQELGIATVAVYSEADAAAPHVILADERYCLGPAAALQSYLVPEKLITAALKTGADAIHPGYGFLSENPALPQACCDNKLIFIGPTAETMRKLGGKIHAKQMMKARGVPVVPGDPEPVATVEQAAAKADKIGYPVLVKAAFGGGGRGMREVFSREELAKGFNEAVMESKSAFNREEVFIEKLIVRPRHVEIQIFSDSHGNHLHLGERECSIQRRHQKLIEESPSVAVDPALRAKMGKAATEVAKAVDYLGAGTVEFLLDQQQNFYFLEMNTRLQVEHPVTEMVLGFDLVAEQIRVARGEKLSFTQEQVSQKGWAIECRICAEESDGSFAPSLGNILALREPSGPFVRVDSGIREGSDVSSYYDSMLSKLIVWGQTRDEAIARMHRALLEYKVVGIHTNIAFHLRVMASPKFRSGDLSIGFIEEERAFLFHHAQKYSMIAQYLAMALEMEREKTTVPKRSNKASRWNKNL